MRILVICLLIAGLARGASAQGPEWEWKAGGLAIEFPAGWVLEEEISPVTLARAWRGATLDLFKARFEGDVDSAGLMLWLEDQRATPADLAARIAHRAKSAGNAVGQPRPQRIGDRDVVVLDGQLDDQGHEIRTLCFEKDGVLLSFWFAMHETDTDVISEALFRRLEFDAAKPIPGHLRPGRPRVVDAPEVRAEGGAWFSGRTGVLFEEGAGWTNHVTVAGNFIVLSDFVAGGRIEVQFTEAQDPPDRESERGYAAYLLEDYPTGKEKRAHKVPFLGRNITMFEDIFGDSARGLVAIGRTLCIVTFEGSLEGDWTERLAVGLARFRRVDGAERTARRRVMRTSGLALDERTTALAARGDSVYLLAHGAIWKQPEDETWCRRLGGEPDGRGLLLPGMVSFRRCDPGGRLSLAGVPLDAETGVDGIVRRLVRDAKIEDEASLIVDGAPAWTGTLRLTETEIERILVVKTDDRRAAVAWVRIDEDERYDPPEVVERALRSFLVRPALAEVESREGVTVFRAWGFALRHGADELQTQPPAGALNIEARWRLALRAGPAEIFARSFDRNVSSDDEMFAAERQWHAAEVDGPPKSERSLEVQGFPARLWVFGEGSRRREILCVRRGRLFFTLTPPRGAPASELADRIEFELGRYD
ncbi:MAG: hypothetical protein R3F20_15065 [Planctomycetota bacterium]